MEVKREDLLNSLSVSGLKLERMLTVLFKKKTNFRIESINTVNFLLSLNFFLRMELLKIHQNI